MYAFSCRWLASLLVSAGVWLGLLCWVADATEATPTRTSVLQLTAGRLTVHLMDVPLSTVLMLLARQSHTRLVLRGPAEEHVSISFTDLPLEEGLTRLLRERSFTLIYKEHAANTLMELHLLPLGDETVLDAIGSFSPDILVSEDDDWESDPVATLARKTLVAKPSSVRQQAAVALGETWRVDAVPPLSQALGEDESVAVRAAAAQALGNTWTPEAVEPLSQALLADDSASVRARAARALGETWNAEAIGPLLDAVRHDPDDQVRDEAMYALRELGYDPDASTPAPDLSVP